MIFVRLITLICLLYIQPLRLYADSLPSNSHRILFLGNSITYDGRYIVDIETYFITHYPGKQYEFINAGLPSETVSGLSEEGHAGGAFPRPDLHERLARVLAQTKPDLVFTNYGMNDGIYLPFDEQRFQKFKEGMIWLHDEVIKSGAKIIHLTPPVYDETKGEKNGYAEVLDRYSQWLLDQRNKAKWEVADIHFPMKKELAERRKTNPAFAFADDAIHPGDEGHWIMAQQVLLHLGEKNVLKAVTINVAIAKHPNGEAILKLVTQRQRMMKDAWLTATGHTRPQMNRGLPLDEATMKATQLEKEIKKLK